MQNVGFYTADFSRYKVVNKMSIKYVCLLLVVYLKQVSGKAQLPRYRGRLQIDSSRESSFDPVSLSHIFLLHGLTLKIRLVQFLMVC